MAKGKSKPREISRIAGVRELTDIGNAERLKDRYGADVRHAPGLGWMVWDGKRWERDETRDGDAVRLLAMRVARGIRDEVRADMQNGEYKDLTAHAARSENASRVSGMAQLFRAMVSIGDDAFDADPWIINTQTGILDVRTGELRPHDRAAMCSMITAGGYEPDAPCERWESFLVEVLPDPAVRLLVQRWAGSCLTGIARDRVVMLLTGSGHNGKGKFIEAIAGALGINGYAAAVNQQFAARRASDPVKPHELAELAGRRMIFGAELKPEMPMDVELIKTLSGGDTIQACRKYKSPFSFMPQCKLVMSANHRPPIPDQTESIWDRLRILTFPNQFVRGVNRDEELPEKLKAEWNGILRWMQEGAAMWIKDGVGTAPSVELEVEQERKDQDPLGGFFDGVVRALPDTFCSCADIHREFDRWARAEGWNDPWKQNKLTRKLKLRGFRYENKASIGRGFHGIAIMDGDKPRPCDVLNRPTTQLEIGARPAPEPDTEPPPEDDVQSGFPY